MASSTTGVWEDDTRTALIESMEKTQRAASLREIEKTQGKSTHSPPRFRVRPAPRFLLLRRARRERLKVRSQKTKWRTASVADNQRWAQNAASHCSNFLLQTIKI
ncbi:MAG: hypothetical protein DMG61_13760 [Acidobacteria bacterium]|nr:MAG: hypothetical protein DMG61_13760 [Acidobacteriota bacterium]